MIILEHVLGETVKQAYDSSKNRLTLKSKIACEALFELAQKYPNEYIIWIEENTSSHIVVEDILSQCAHQREMLSFSNKNYFPNCIGYIENSPFLKINSQVKYPTWQMSSQLGGALGSQLLQFKNTVSEEMGLDYMLCSIVKLGQHKGLCCYRLPLETLNTVDVKQATTSIVFKFVRQHYSLHWQFLLLCNFIIFENKWPFVQMLKSICTQKRLHLKTSLPPLNVKKEIIAQPQIDVIIPTMGRASYLYDVLKDFSKQTILPQTIIIVEQNPDNNATTELDYIKTETWPFTIKHIFIHQTGACNARNLALKETKSHWVFLADDDNRFSETLIEDCLKTLTTYSASAITTNYPQKGEISKDTEIKQWSTFGSGNSIVKSSCLDFVSFNTAYEHGYGEDADFGMQLRNNGVDVLYNPNIKITHLKAPVGGFRKPVVFAWSDDEIQPKPSPTVMLFLLKHRTPEQVKGYKLLLFLKFYRKQSIKNPIRYIRVMKKRWNASVKWANYLDK